MDPKHEYITTVVHFPNVCYSRNFFLCNKCKKFFLPRYFDCYEFGVRFFPLISQITRNYICDDCYNYLPRISYCATCNEKFASRNSLFGHLKETNHYK